MLRKSLIIYASQTGNTEKVALRFKKVFEEKGWECDCIKATEKMKPVNPDDYNLVCVGSPILGGVPAREITRIWMRRSNYGNYRDNEASDPPQGPPALSILTWRQDPSKIKKGIAFVTYAGSRRGPAEAMPALALMELQMEDKGYRCIGKLACPGKMAGYSTTALEQQRDRPKGPEKIKIREWHWNLHSRPHKRDLQKAETFLAEILEDYFLPSEVPPDSQYICIA